MKGDIFRSHEGPRVCGWMCGQNRTQKRCKLMNNSLDGIFFSRLGVILADTGFLRLVFFGHNLFFLWNLGNKIFFGTFINCGHIYKSIFPRGMLLVKKSGNLVENIPLIFFFIIFHRAFDFFLAFVANL